MNFFKVELIAALAVASFQLALAGECTVPSVSNGIFYTLNNVAVYNNNDNNNYNENYNNNNNNNNNNNDGFPRPIRIIPYDPNSTPRPRAYPAYSTPSIAGHAIPSRNTPSPLGHYIMPGVSYRQERTEMAAGVIVRDGESVYLDCSEGYQAVNASYFTCMPDGKWLPLTSSASCRKTCNTSPMPNVTNGALEREQGGIFGFINYGPGYRRRITCNDGYYLASGRNYIECQADATWSTPGVCTAYTCNTQSLPNLVGATYVSVPSSNASSVTYRCNQGLVVSGTFNATEGQIVCQSNRTWRSAMPCGTERSCPIPMIPNAEVALGDSTVNSVRRVRCRYQRTLAVTITCSSNGTWVASGSCPSSVWGGR